MSLQPDTDRRLRRTSGEQLTLGSRLLLVAGVMFAVGLLFMIATSGFGDFVGVALATLATPLTLGGVGLMLTGLVARRASEHRPFA
jgi:hypothetical protein